MKLNVGSGGLDIDGYIPIDNKETDNDKKSAYPLHEKYKNVSEIRASHILEHFPYREAEAIIQHWVDRLQPGGVLKIAVPDFEKIIKAYESGDPMTCGYLMGGQVDDSDYHKAIFNESTLFGLMENAGLVNIESWSSELNDCASLDVSLNLKGVKPIQAKPKIQAVMSTPRLGFMDNFFTAYQALMPLQIPLRKHSGAYWQKSLTNAIQQAVDDGADYILTIDYDSVFTRYDVETLIELAMSTDADAIAPIQQGRGKEYPLFTLAPEHRLNNSNQVDRDTFTADPTFPGRTAHFGLTLIKVSALLKMKKPWFTHTPDENGEWGDGSEDDDVYFWRNFGESGLKLQIATGVCIGHIEVMVKWPDYNMETIYQPVSEYNKLGRPDDVWKR